MSPLKFPPKEGGKPPKVTGRCSRNSPFEEVRLALLCSPLKKGVGSLGCRGLSLRHSCYVNRAPTMLKRILGSWPEFYQQVTPTALPWNLGCLRGIDQ